MNKKRIEQMSEMIKNTKLIINPAIMEFSMEEWKEIKEMLTERHSTIQGGSIIIDAMGGNSEIKELESRFQCESFEAIYSYAEHLRKAHEIGKKIQETKKDMVEGQKKIKEIFG